MISARQLDQRLRAVEQRMARFTTGKIQVWSNAPVVDDTAVVPGVTDHGALTGLSDDDHPQYALLAGRSGGQTLDGGTGASERLNLQSTAHATRGVVRVNDTTLEINGDGVAGTDEDPRVSFTGGDGGTDLVVTTFIQDSSTEINRAYLARNGTEIGSIWDTGPSTTADQDTTRRLLGGDGSNRVRYVEAYDASADLLDLHFEQETAGTFNALTGNWYFGYNGASVTSRSTNIRMYAGDGSNSRHTIFAGTSAGLAVSFSTPASMSFTLTTSATATITAANMNLTGSTTFDVSSGTYTHTSTGVILTSILNSSTTSWRLRQSSNDYYQADTSNVRVILGNTGQAAMHTVIRHGSSGYVAIENATRDARIILSGNELLLNDQTDVAPRTTNMTSTQRDALTASLGMFIYNTTTGTLQAYVNNGGSPAWLTIV